MNTKEYLSDEELLRLIDRAESDGLLAAPRDLKGNALNLICHSEGAQQRKNPEERSFASLRMTGEGALRMTGEGALRMTGELQADNGTGSSTEQKRKNAKNQFRRYCIRVGLGCAACLAVLFSTGPIGQKVQSAAESISGISRQASQFSSQISDAVDQVSGVLTDEFFGGMNHNE